MVFKMVTLDLTQPYEDDFNPPSLLESPSHTTTLCCPAIAASSTLVGLNLRGRPKRRGHQADKDFMEFLHQQARNTRIFSFRALQVATDNFTAENIIGQGLFGKVYKGRLANGYVVAAKRMSEHATSGMMQFQAELKLGNIPKHPNVMHLLGFCSDHKDELLLLYPFMVNRDVAWYLRERPESVPPLNWQTRMSIALGAARGLLHLHSHNIIHCDIKATNILLDDRLVPIIADFGLAIFLDEKSSHKPPPSEHITETADKVEADLRGTIGYIAPEYLSTGYCSKKIDVFGFGVMLFELITGQTAYDLARLADAGYVTLLDWVKQHLKNGTHIHQLLIDQAMEGDYEENEVELLMMIALLCTQDDPRERPNMLQVVQFLQGSTRMDEMANIQSLMRNLLATNLSSSYDSHCDLFIKKYAHLGQ